MRLKSVKNKPVASEKLAAARKEVRDRELERDKFRNHGMKKKEKRSVTAKALSPDPAWKTLPMRFKEEMILEWSITGGVIMGRRLNKAELASAMRLSQAQVDGWIQKAEKAQLETFANKESVREIFYKIVTNLLHHIRSDRARSIQHADLLDQEIEMILRKREEAEAMPEANPSERQIKRTEINHWTTLFRSISYLKTESLGILFQSTEAFNKFLHLFAGQKAGSNPTAGGIQAILGGSEDVKPESFVNSRQAIEILSEQQGSILPTQSIPASGMNRNPNDGFDNFVDPGLSEEIS